MGFAEPLAVAAATSEATDPQHVLLLLALLAELAWFVVVIVFRVERRPAHPHAAAETLDLGDEPPAVVNLVCHGWTVTREAVVATLLDLAARRVVTLDQDGDSVVCRVKKATTRGLRLYEKRVLQVLKTNAVDGVVPAGALETGNPFDDRRWWSAFKSEVINDAQDRGLSRDVWDRSASVVLLGLSGATLAIGALAAAVGQPGQPNSGWGTAFVVGYGIAIVLAMATSGFDRNDLQHDTAEGRRVASRWLGVRAGLVADGTFDSLPPAAVNVWDRYLAYAAALGAAPGAVRRLPLGAEDDHRAWSVRGGSWRPVRVHYPSPLSGWGIRPARALVASALALVAAGAGLAATLVAGAPRGSVRGLWVAGVAAIMAIIAWQFRVFTTAIGDLGSDSVVRGEVLRLRPRWRPTFRDDQNRRHHWYVAVDPGTGSSVRAWPVSAEMYAVLQEGDEVAVTLASRSGFVRSIEVSRRGRRSKRGSRARP